jgi:lysyl-tRNA synthetase class 1
LDRFLEKHGNDPGMFVAWANRLELFSDVTFLLEGVNAWLADDLVKAVHVLVPQIEHGLRKIAEDAGEPVTKSHRVSEGVGVSIGMGDILNSKNGVVETLGPDITLYFLALYADPRGRNVRNRVAHGLLTPEDVSEGLVRWLVHTLLVLGFWEELSKARR